MVGVGKGLINASFKKGFLVLEKKLGKRTKGVCLGWEEGKVKSPGRKARKGFAKKGLGALKKKCKLGNQATRGGTGGHTRRAKPGKTGVQKSQRLLRLESCCRKKEADAKRLCWIKKTWVREKTLLLEADRGIEGEKVGGLKTRKRGSSSKGMS